MYLARPKVVTRSTAVMIVIHQVISIIFMGINIAWSQSTAVMIVINQVMYY
jgi:hypothetical protein